MPAPSLHPANAEARPVPCLLVAAALFAPRLAIVLLWFLTEWFRATFDTLLWPILGFVFLPTTLIWYAVVQQWFGGEWTLWPIVGIVIALLVDLSPAKGGPPRRA